MDNYRVTAAVLNVRDAPSLKGKVIGYLTRDQIVEKHSISGDEYWYEISSPGGVKGWCSHKFLVTTSNDPVILTEDSPWLVVAFQELGQKEFPDTQKPAENPRIMEYLRSTSLSASMAATDETDWCSAFVNWCMEKSGYEGTDSARARSWLNWGKSINAPVRGCIVIFSRVCPNGVLNICGHVGFYIRETPTHIEVLGGNQADAVNLTLYDKGRLLGYRLPGP